MTLSADQLANHLDELRSYLQREQPLLAELVDDYRQLDQVAYRMALLPPNQSFADRVSWWPLISILGTFSAGKSTFINDYLEHTLQRTGHQAVDDKFTVISFAADGHSSTLPGSALDADPRFPFFSISQEIDQATDGEGRRLDSYLQLKTCGCEKLKGKIFVDSPGFDADDQRTATLSIADRIIDRSDLVMVFFDAHRPEPGAIRDTLEHLVVKAINRSDSTKFIYILNQIDVTADENNLEDVVAAWQRALAQKGLTAGRFYRIFSQTACTHIENEAAAQRLIEWREQDMAAIEERLAAVEMERIYRVADSLLTIIKDIEGVFIPDLKDRLSSWRRFVLLGDSVFMGITLAALLVWLVMAGSWEGLAYSLPPAVDDLMASGWLSGSLALLGSSLFVGWHILFRRWGRQRYRPVDRDRPAGYVNTGHISMQQLDQAYLYSTRGWRTIFWPLPGGWHWLNQQRLTRLYNRTTKFIQKINDMHINPSEEGVQKQGEKPEK